MGFAQELRFERFYSDWEDRFETETDKYITPNDTKVVRAAEKAAARIGTNKSKAMDAWQYVYDRVDYRLSKEWKEPRQTLMEGVGDCEDVTFLLASMFPNMGIDESKVVLGKLRFPDGYEEAHTWNVVDGKVIDATGSPELEAERTYIADTTWRIVNR